MLRHALRIQLRQPGVTALIVATLALGLGAAVAVLNVVHGVLLRPLDYPRPHELVRIHETYETLRTSPNSRLQAIWNRITVSRLNADDWRGESTALVGVGLHEPWDPVLTGGAEPERLAGTRLDAELLQVLGVEPALGRRFDAADVNGQAPVVLVSHGFWQEVLGGDPAAPGAVIVLDGEPFTVTGVMPPGFQVPGRPEDRIWAPIRFAEEDLLLRDASRFEAVGRLAPGASLETARAELDGIAAALAEAWPETNTGSGVRLVPLRESVVGDSRPLLRLLLAAAGLVLLVACVNVAHLLLARATARRRELAIRVALGASRARLVRQLMLEALLLALAGGGAGVALAAITENALLAWIPADLPRTASVSLDGNVLLIALAVSLLAGFLCGAVPALRASGTGLLRNLHAGGGPLRGGRSWSHGALVVSEVALTLVLTAGGGLLLNSLARLAAVDPGFAPAGVLTQEIRLPVARYDTPARRADFAERLLGSLAALPGVERAALTSKLPVAGRAYVWGFRVAGRDPEPDGDWTQGRSTSMKFVTPGYFRALGIPLGRGRLFDETDRPERGLVLLVNETAARRHWPGGDAVGATVTMGSQGTSYTVVGVVGDIRHDGLAADPGTLMYQPWAQAPPAEMTAVVRAGAAGAPALSAAAVRDAVRGLDAGLPLPPAEHLDRIVAGSLHAPRARAVLVGALAAIGLTLALVGTYAVMAFFVQRRVPEIGVRIALGATPAHVRRLVLRRVLVLAAGGLALGAAGALAGSRLLSGMLFGVAPHDPLTLGAAAVAILGVCLLAGWIPARRAGGIDPVAALRKS